VSASDKVRSVEIPADLNVIAEYPAAVIKNAADPVRARDFLDLLRSPQGQKRFEEAGFLRASDGGGT
jgi:molybdate transport system substrate-binding protein